MTINNKGRRWIWGVVIALAVLHQDLWWWDNRSLVLGFLPIGLFYHAVFSVAAAATWAAACRWAWPAHIEDWADGAADDHSSAGFGKDASRS